MNVVYYLRFRQWWKDTRVYQLWDFSTDIVSARFIYMADGAKVLKKHMGFPYDDQVYFEGALTDPNLWYRVVVG